MGISGIGPGSLLVILAIVLLIFGTKRLRNLGKDLGGSIKGFKSAMSEDGEPEEKLQNGSSNNEEESSGDSLVQKSEKAQAETTNSDKTN